MEGAERGGRQGKGEFRRSGRGYGFPQTACGVRAADVPSKRVHEDAQAEHDDVVQLAAGPRGDHLGGEVLRQAVESDRWGDERTGGIRRLQSGGDRDLPRFERKGAGMSAKFEIGDDVFDPISKLNGTVIKINEPPYDWMGFQYEVVLSNGTRTSYEEDYLQHPINPSDVFALCENRNFASYADYMIVNTLFKIDNVNSNTISTFRASRTQFKAYQFKPLLKFFASPEKRILIADEVGLGKTIEAGHILLELKARKEFRHVIIVCPKSLREKWRTEMWQRFGLDFTIYGGGGQ